MPDTDLINLYSKRILRLASEIPHLGRLDSPIGSAKVRAPLCGSAVSADVVIAQDRVVEFAQDVKACALGQAAAAIVGANVIGMTRPEIATGRDQLSEMLKSGGSVPDAPFAEFEVLLPARDFTNRHASILLSFDAALGAFDDARKADCA